MDYLKTIARSLGMDENSSEEQVIARIDEQKRQGDELSQLKAENEAREKREKAEKVKAALDKAVADRRINAQQRTSWEKMLNDDFETANALLEAIAPIEALSKQISFSVKEGKIFTSKTFDELQDDPKALAELEKDHPEAFKALFDDWKERNKINN